ncbi:MAG: hypothetical protein DWQ04_19310 [Chloroflexi bacterium]|nr:MAG: hypothetical protein DWQ04_19310 [Chloroflexota bacterium]
MVFHVRINLANQNDEGAMFASPSLCRFLTSPTEAAVVQLCLARFLPNTTEQMPRYLNQK